MLAGLASKVLPALGIGALTGLASTGVQKLVGNGLYVKKGGCVCEVETDGKRLLLEPVSKKSFTKLGDGLFVLNRQLNKKLVTKANKHEKLEVLAEEILNKISNHISVALNDSKIPAEEFSLILSEANTFLETKEKLRSKSKENTHLESKVVKPLLHRMQTLK